jgi:hypothetical protein
MTGGYEAAYAPIPWTSTPPPWLGTYGLLMDNVKPLLELMDEKDKLSAERKVVETLLNKFGGRAKHSELMNACHMRKREFSETIASLIDREAVTVESYTEYRHTGKIYVLNQAIIESWGK